ncbi:hypothetical protein M5689_011720 [Euphorbia peplus]|nr:hypothetical protein M5689_011720 [Euphorbia peplus]
MDDLCVQGSNASASTVAGSSRSQVLETDILELEKALHAQQQLLQKLYNELDEERESAATAASEALSMILRLQGEKASLKMEASQYKRMAEEKMCHAEEALAVFEDLTYEREMEIAALEFQLQAYRYRLLSMGLTDVGVSEVKFPENLLMQRNENLFGEKGVINSSSTIRRLSSGTVLPIKDSNSKKIAIERRKSLDPESIPGAAEGNTIQENADSEKKLSTCVSVDLNSYWDQIKKLDERIKELSDNKDSGRHRSPLLKGLSWSPTLFAQEANTACSSGVQDIFEVPRTETRKSSESLRKENRKLILERENRLMKPDSVTDEITELLPSKIESDRLKFPATNERKMGKPRSTGNNTSPEYQQLSRRLERLERSKRQEIVGGGEAELNLLKEISVQLKVLQTEMKSLKAKKPNVPIEPSLDPLREAMLYFWL